MSLRRGHDHHKHHEHADDVYLSDFEYHEDADSKLHRQRVRKLLEERLEKKRLKKEMDDFDEDEFDWEDNQR
jgi:hypothetical protein